MGQGRIVLAGTNSGCGKTTLSIGIMAAMKKKGRCVQAFKVGPDYIDPMFHSYVTGRKGCNLDSWLLGQNTVRYLWKENAKDADFSIIEGVMGLYDGFGTEAPGSTAETAKQLQSPVVLIVNAQGMSRSAAALIQGFCHFDPEVKIAGVIFNRMKSESQYRLLSKIIKQNTDVEPLGYLKEDRAIQLKSRYLGLKTAAEVENLKEKIDWLADSVLETVDLEKVEQLGYAAPEISCFCPLDQKKVQCFPGVRIGVAKDEAFCFYYEDNFSLLEKMGAVLVPFSPMQDSCLPENLDGLYFGGGYPEQYAQRLFANRTLRKEIHKKAEQGMPIYGECGGFLYLCDSIADYSGRIFEMAGILHGTARMTNRLGHFGYVETELKEDCIFGSAGEKIKAHEFHYSKEEIQEKSYFKVIKKREEKESVWESGYGRKNVIGGYPHFHFWANPHFAEAFLKNCKGEKYD